MSGNTANQVRRVTPADGHYFHGYYDICPWDASGARMLVMKVPFMDRPPMPTDIAELGFIEMETGRFQKLADTRAWNFQQGCFLQWLPTAPDRLIIYNDLLRSNHVSVVFDIHEGVRRVLPRPIGAVSANGRYGLTLNFARLFRTRPGYGYGGFSDPFAAELHPALDGVGLLDLATGEYRLAVSVAEAFACLGKPGHMLHQEMWFNHVYFNTTDTRFSFLCRWRVEKGGWLTEFFAADLTGANLRRLAPRDMTSHYDWRDDKTILAFATVPPIGTRLWLVSDGNASCEVVADGIIMQDTHCSYSNDRRWILNDTYPHREHRRGLFLWDVEGKRRIELGAFHSDPAIAGEIRCDLHPCWSRDDRHVSFDSIHEGFRGVYVMDVSGYTGA
jgi:hypothetical protein